MHSPNWRISEGLNVAQETNSPGPKRARKLGLGDVFWWIMFKGNYRSRGGADISKQESTHLSFKLAFHVTNDITEYEALILGLNAAKDKGIRNIKVFGDVNLIIQQVNKTFQARHPRLKAYRDKVWRFKNSFDSFSISYIPRIKNQLTDSLAVSTSMFIPPMPPRLVYEV